MYDVKKKEKKKEQISGKGFIHEFTTKQRLF
jgi:hypothetical protein